MYPNGVAELFHFGPEGTIAPQGQTPMPGALALPDNGIHMVCLQDSDSGLEGKLKYIVECTGHA